jgi:hypothetical protein
VELKTMNEYREIILNNSKTLPYIKKCLLSGHTLSKTIIENISLENSWTSTWFPTDGNEENLYNFKYGGIIPEPPKSEWHKSIGKEGNKAIWVPIRSVIVPIINTIRIFVSEDERRICFFDDTLAKSTDSGLSEYSTLLKTYNNEVYHLINRERSTDKEIHETINWTYSFWPPIIGILTSLPDFLQRDIDEKQITVEIIETAGKRTEMIIVSAYDGEGYLIWHKNP